MNNPNIVCNSNNRNIFDVSKYSLSDLTESNIYLNYALHNDSPNEYINNIEYLIKNKLFVPEYITELYFNTRSDKNHPIEPFSRIGIYDLINKNISYELYSTQTNFNSSWKAKHGNALVGIELHYNNSSIQQIRFLEASIMSEHSIVYNEKNRLFNNVFVSEWYGNNNTDSTCVNCVKNGYQLIYFNNMFISGFNIKYSSSINSFQNVYFKIGSFIMNTLIDKTKCCITNLESPEYLCCKILHLLDHCTIQDNNNMVKNNLVKCIRSNINNTDIPNIDNIIDTNVNTLITNITNNNKKIVPKIKLSESNRESHHENKNKEYKEYKEYKNKKINSDETDTEELSPETNKLKRILYDIKKEKEHFKNILNDKYQIRENFLYDSCSNKTEQYFGYICLFIALALLFYLLFTHFSAPCSKKTPENIE
jgi:hypothetical protein